MIQIDPHTDEERDTLLHMLGLGLAGRKRVSHRNYFAADPGSNDDRMLHDMAQAGLVRLRSSPDAFSPCNFFVVTAEGKDAVRRFYGEFREDVGLIDTNIRSFTVRVRSLSLFDQQALHCLAGGHSASTYCVAKACGFPATSTARTLLRRLERWGLAQGIRPPNGVVRIWRITDAGRRAIGGEA